MADDELWKKRFLIFNLARLFGVAVILLGAAVAYTDLVREGGWPMVGLVIAAVGAVDALVSPRLLKKAWNEEDRRKQ